MKTFYREVNKDSREAMIEFLSGHFRYYTANSWNKSTSYANNLKFYNLGLDMETVDRLVELHLCEGFYDSINHLVYDFGSVYNWLWQAGFNGRNSGYLVLYQGEYKPTGYKSQCSNCGQFNYKTIEESNNICSVCKQPKRINLTKPYMRGWSFPGRGTDVDNDFEDWDIYQLQDRVELVQSFDMLADSIASEAVNIANEYEAGEEEYSVVKTRQILLKRTS